eukprot:COSAG05_NODE_5518_length_1154_cov_1.376303_1_plen_307_part_01
MSRYCRQLGALVRRGLLAKLYTWQGSLLELLLPVAFSALLVLLKYYATVYESPAVAYSCGPAAPFSFDPPAPVLGGDLSWLGCYQEPAGGVCTPEGGEYYQNPIDIPPVGTVAATLGYVDFTSFPVDAFACGNCAGAGAAPPTECGSCNPSDAAANPDAADWPYPSTLALLGNRGLAPALSIVDMLDRMAGVRTDGSTPPPALLALAPEDPALSARVDDFKTWLDQKVGCGDAPLPPRCDSIRVFESEAAMEAYINDVAYDDVPPNPDFTKIGMAVVFQEVQPDNVEGPWRYAIRSNFTSPIFGQQQ